MRRTSTIVRAGYFSIQSTTSHARLATGSLTIMAAFKELSNNGFVLQGTMSAALVDRDVLERPMSRLR
jgi:hypothetical protein